MMWGSMIGLGAVAIAAYWFGTREGRSQMADMQRMLAQAESSSAALRQRARVGDTLLANSLRRELDSLRAKAEAAASNGNDKQIQAMKAEIERHTLRQQGLAAMDMTAISAQNDRAVAFLITELDGVL